MRFFTKLSERELDGILAGKVSEGELEDVATFIREMRNSLLEAPPPRVDAGHLAAIFEEARHVHPSTAAPAISSRAPRRLAARAAIAAVGLAALAAFCGAAYAGVLPAPVQGTVADLAGKVGLSLPDKADHPKPHGGVPEKSGDTGQSNVDHPAQSNGDQQGGDQGDRGVDTNQANGDQGNGDHGSPSSGQRGNQQGTQGSHNEQGTTNGGGANGDGQQGNGARDDNQNG